VREQSGTTGKVVCLYRHTALLEALTEEAGLSLTACSAFALYLWFQYSINAIIDGCVQLRFNRVMLLKYSIHVPILCFCCWTEH
jgi:hypothetical protein